MACETPELNVRDNVLEDLITYQTTHPVYLYIHLGAGSDVLHNRNTSFRMPFTVYKNPTVNHWGPEPLDFKIYDGDEFIRITVSRNAIGDGASLYGLYAAIQANDLIVNPTVECRYFSPDCGYL